MSELIFGPWGQTFDVRFSTFRRDPAPYRCPYVAWITTECRKTNIKDLTPSVFGAVVGAEELPLLVTRPDEPKQQDGDERLLGEDAEDHQAGTDDHRHPDRDQKRDALAEKQPQKMPQDRVAVERRYGQ